MGSNIIATSFKRIGFILLYPGLLVTFGCGSSLSLREQAVSDYQKGHFVKSETLLTGQIEKKMPASNYVESKDAVWMLLDRAMARTVLGKTKESISDYSLALDAIDYYLQNSFFEMSNKLLIDDRLSAYSPPPFEQVLARFYFALALLQMGDIANAQALLLQADTAMQCQLEEKVPERLSQNALVKYFFAALLEQREDFSNARILYTQVGKLIGERYVQDDIERIKKRGRSKEATVICLCHNGQVPHKVSTFAPTSIVCAYTLETLLASQNIKPALSTLTGIPVPKLTASQVSPKTTKISCGSEVHELITWYDIDQVAHQQLDYDLPKLAARAAARLIMRRCAVATAAKKNELAGYLTDFGMLIANLSTQADTRSWGTLPSRLDFARFEIKPGTCDLLIETSSFTSKHRLSLKEGDFCVINVFNINPAHPVVLIPKQFLTEGEAS